MDKVPRTLSDQASAELDALRTAGYTLTDNDVIVINALCWEIENPSRRISLARGKPVKCGSLWLWPRSIRHCKWFTDVGADMRKAELALAYSMANPSCDPYAITDATINEFERTLDCTLGQLRVAMADILMQGERDEVPSNKCDSVSIEELAQLMVATHGGTFEMWEAQCSIPYILDFLDTQAKQHQAEGHDMAKDRANMALAYYIIRLKRRQRNKVNG